MKKLMSLFIIASVALACTDDDIRSEHIYDNGPKIVGFTKSVENIAYFEDLGVQEQDVLISLIGLGNASLSSSPIDVTYEVDLDHSTATEGVEFDFADDTHKVTIPANGTFTKLPVLVNTGQLNPTQKTELVLKLTESSNGVVGEQYSTIKIIFVGCSTNLQGNYLSGTAPTTVTKITPNTYRSNRLPGISVGGQPAWFEFSDVCGELEILTWQLQDGYPIVGPDGGAATGVVLQPTGNLRFDNVSLVGVSFYANRTFTLVRQ